MKLGKAKQRDKNQLIFVVLAVCAVMIFPALRIAHIFNKLGEFVAAHGPNELHNKLQVFIRILTIKAIFVNPINDRLKFSEFHRNVEGNIYN